MYLYFVFEFFQVFVFVFKYYSEYLTPTLIQTRLHNPSSSLQFFLSGLLPLYSSALWPTSLNLALNYLAPTNEQPTPSNIGNTPSLLLRGLTISKVTTAISRLLIIVFLIFVYKWALFRATTKSIDYDYGFRWQDTLNSAVQLNPVNIRIFLET